MAAADVSLASDLGVSAEIIENLRRNHLTEGEHWTREEGKRVVFTAIGIAAVLSHLDLPPCSKKEGPPSECACEVVRIHPSPYFVRVRVSDGSLHDVRVSNNRTLRPRIRIRCRLSEGRWECCQPGIGVKLQPMKKGESAAS